MLEKPLTGRFSVVFCRGFEAKVVASEIGIKIHTSFDIIHALFNRLAYIALKRSQRIRMLKPFSLKVCGEASHIDLPKHEALLVLLPASLKVEWVADGHCCLDWSSFFHFAKILRQDVSAQRKSDGVEVNIWVLIMDIIHGIFSVIGAASVIHLRSGYWGVRTPSMIHDNSSPSLMHQGLNCVDHVDIIIMPCKARDDDSKL